MKASNRRRKLLTMLGIGGAAAAAAAMSRAEAQPGAPPAEPGLAQGKGYQLTEHVRKYYRTTRM